MTKKEKKEKIEYHSKESDSDCKKMFWSFLVFVVCFSFLLFCDRWEKFTNIDESWKCLVVIAMFIIVIISFFMMMLFRSGLESSLDEIDRIESEE